MSEDSSEGECINPVVTTNTQPTITTETQPTVSTTVDINGFKHNESI